KIESEFIYSVRNAGIELSEDVVLRIEENLIVIGIKATGSYAEGGFIIEFGSEVVFYTRDVSFTGSGFEISFGSSGSFTPLNKASYWRTIHASSILKNWDSFCEIAKHATQKYSELVKIIIGK
ncbi:MAG: hypothetical protein ACKO96_10405, partial [Flammeovirgaceae bacterium]